MNDAKRTSHPGAYDALRASELRFRSAFEAGSDSRFIVDEQTLKILEANSPAEALYGYTREELLDMTATDLSAEPSETAESIRQFAAQPVNEMAAKGRTMAQSVKAN